MFFDYIGLNKANQKVEGEVSADDLASARSRLHEMGLTVLAINERKQGTPQSKQETQTKDFVSFEFKGIDKKNKEIIGTIDAKDAFSAYVRLRKEFFFEVIYMFDLALEEAEQEKQKEALVKKMEEQFKAAGLDLEDETPQKNEEHEIDDVSQVKLEILRNQVDIMLAQIKAILKKLGEDPKKSLELGQIKTLIAELERVKMSNNIKHIHGVADRILAEAENLLKDRDEIQVVFKQKENISAANIERLQQQQYRASIEVEGISKALQKAADFFNKYARRIGVHSAPTKPEQLKKTTVSADDLVKKLDITKKSRQEIATDLKKNLTSFLSFSRNNKISKKEAFHSLLILLRAYFKKPSTKTQSGQKMESKGTTGWREFFNNRPNPHKKDYYKVFAEIHIFLGWLLAFYLFYFYTGALILQKNIPLSQDFLYKTLTSKLLIVLFFAFFVFHLMLKLKLKFFRQNFIMAFLLFCCGSFCVLFYSINF